MFKCPECGLVQSCPCAPCKQLYPKMRYWEALEGFVIKCAGCGLTKDSHWWEAQQAVTDWVDGTEEKGS